LVLLTETRGEKFDKLKDVIILNTGSTLSATFMNEELVVKRKEAESTLFENECWK